MNRHTDTQFEAELEGLSSHLNLMGARAEGMLQNAIRALVTRDAALARAVVDQDADLDRLEMEADRRCLHVLARRSPVGEDLRFVVAGFKVSTDVERIGDLAVNIAERGMALSGGSGIEADEHVRVLADRVMAQLSEALGAFVSRDTTRAEALYASDRGIDELNRQAFRALLELARQHPDQIERALALSSICKHLERIGDHSVNIGEHTIFLVEGRDVRHGGG